MKLEKLSTLKKCLLLLLGMLAIVGVALTGNLWNTKETIGPQPEGDTEELFVFGTCDTMDGLEVDQIYTDHGIYEIEPTVEVTPYLYRCVQAVIKEQKILHIKKEIKKEVKLKNCLIMKNTNDSVTIFSDQYQISLPCKVLTAKFTDEIADIVMKNGSVSKISTKQELISAKILSVKENGVELEGYGVVPLSEHFRFYETFGNYAEKPPQGLVVGYEQAKLVVAEGEICAALLKEPISVKKIRVLLKTTDYDSIVHPLVKIKLTGDYEAFYGDQSVVFDGGTEITVDETSEYLKNGRMVFRPKNEQARIEVTSITRACGTPAYEGTLELVKDPEGIVLINEVDLETYLCGVVPSEMPAGYELEALKVQAVCARSYAYRQILLNSYAAYGAHVDDSVSFQVYNNLKSDEKIKKAVEETKGQVLMYGDEVALTYYFSTSCGYTTNETIWGNGSLENKYISGKLLTDEKKQLDLTEEQRFRDFILNETYTTYDSGESWYRWELTVPVKQISENVKQWKEIGEVKEIAVIQRNEGGVLQKIRIIGEKGEVEIPYEYDIRTVLNGKGQTIHRKHGKDTEAGAMLPSGFFVIDRVEEEGELQGFLIRGGGFGHGAGMSQNGANHMAEAGKTYEEILEMFYQGTKLSSF